jgi:hypothetical protein
MNLEQLELTLKKLEALKGHVENYFESEEQNPGVSWTLFPIGHAIDHALNEIATYIQHQQTSEERKAS